MFRISYGIALLITNVMAISVPAQASVAEGVALNHLPLIFEENKGQMSATVEFILRGPGYTVFLYCPIRQ